MEVQDFGSLTICALRYCFGRMTYMPSLIVDATKANWHLLSKNDKVIIQKDLAWEFDNDRDMGMDCDKEMWLRFYNWVLDQNSKEQRRENLREISSIIQEVDSYE